jgi:hypothetical protein
VTATAIRFAGRIASIALAWFALGMLASCGSGAVSGSSVTGTPVPITITPADATLYSDLPTTFVLSGGNGSYVVSSSNQAVVASAGTVNSHQLVVVPNTVGADTPLSLIVSDTAGTTPATAALTVKPRTISNVVTVTPSVGQAAACGTSVCSGGDAEVKVTLQQGGVALAGRSVRFDVLSGDVRIITSAAGSSETLSTSGTTTTDSTGTARMRVRVLADAPAQTALLQVTDASTGFVQTASVAIAPSSNAPLTVRPTDIRFTGPNSTTCSTSVNADIVIVGGRPPYQVTQPPGFSVFPLVVSSSGSRVTVTSTGQCTSSDSGQPVSIIDNAGATAIVALHNEPAPTATQTATFVASPKEVTLDTCQAIAQIALAGGTGAYFAASGHTSVNADTTSTFGRIQRRASTPATTLPSVTVTFSDGRTTQDVKVNLVGAGAGPC